MASVAGGLCLEIGTLSGSWIAARMGADRHFVSRRADRGRKDGGFYDRWRGPVCVGGTGA